MTTPSVFLIDRPLVRHTEMYMFDLQLLLQSTVQLAVQSQIVPPIHNHIKQIKYISVSHTNRRSIKNAIGVVVNCLVGMGLDPL